MPPVCPASAGAARWLLCQGVERGSGPQWRQDHLSLCTPPTQSATIGPPSPRDPSVEDLVLSVDEHESYMETTINLRLSAELTSLRKLLVSGFFVPINRITAPNLIHLSFETLLSSSGTTPQSILSMLQGCSQLETVLVNILSGGSRTPRSHAPVTLPKLRSVELGHGETAARLPLHLRFPPTVAVGFRDITGPRPWSRESIQHVLATIDIETVTLAHIQQKADLGFREVDTYLIRFEGLESLPSSKWVTGTPSALMGHCFRILHDSETSKPCSLWIAIHAMTS